MLLPWLVDNFQIRKPVYVIRHPYAVVASQLKHPGWANVPWKNGFQKGFVYPHVAEQYSHCIGTMTSREEYLITLWCLENKFLLEHPYHTQGKWHFTSYEQLVMDPATNFQAIFDAIALPLPTQVLAAVSKPSYSVVKGDLESDPKAQLSKWRKQLSTAQLDIIGKVLERFDMKLYSFDNDLLLTAN